jgi:hypothetical protein
MFCESVRSIAIRSIPIPQPPVGGKPYSRAVQNASSSAIASSSPDCRLWGESKVSQKGTQVFRKRGYRNVIFRRFQQKVSGSGYIPSVALQIAVFAPMDHSTRCRHCIPIRRIQRHRITKAKQQQKHRIMLYKLGGNVQH